MFEKGKKRDKLEELSVDCMYPVRVCMDDAMLGGCPFIRRSGKV